MSAHLDNLDGLVLRPARDSDAQALERLAQLDEAKPLTGESVVAEVGGEIHAAVQIGDRVVIADPFRPTAELVDLLDAVAVRLRDDHHHRARVQVRARRRSTHGRARGATPLAYAH